MRSSGIVGAELNEQDILDLLPPSLGGGSGGSTNDAPTSHHSVPPRPPSTSASAPLRAPPAGAPRPPSQAPLSVQMVRLHSSAQAHVFRRAVDGDARQQLCCAKYVDLQYRMHIHAFTLSLILQHSCVRRTRVFYRYRNGLLFLGLVCLIGGILWLCLRFL